MNAKILPAFLVLIFTSTQVLAARPSITSLQQQINQVEAEADNLDARVTALEDSDCPSNAPTRFSDNGDGTICDSVTGLMWEKKDAGVMQGLPNPHDMNNLYTWSSTGAAPDGTAFTDFLVRLNSATGDPNVVGFAGHTDWRLPNSAELQTIRDCSFHNFDTPCIDPIFGPTNLSFYWSSTSVASNLNNAWEVSFSTLFVNENVKVHGRPVRAVRGGW